MITSLESNGLRFDMFTGEERFIAPNAVLVSARALAKLAALVPAPRVHLVRFHGVLALAAP